MQLKRFNHDLSFTHGTTVDMGTLVPVAAIDVLPGDTFRISQSLLARVAPLAKPVMHKVDIRLHNWFVPNRIIWDDWEEFIVGNEGSATYPTITPASVADAELYDRMGAEPVAGVAYDALPIRAFNLIWNEFYRDQDLATARTTDQLDIPRIAWGKDYFTTARANPQQGAAVEVGFSAGSVPVVADNVPAGNQSVERTTTTGTADPLRIFNVSGSELEADLSQATGGIDINELRNAISLQRIAEAREFFGSRYVDYLRWYGVNPRDGRLDRPEYLGGGRQTISFSEVLATSDSGTADVGDLFGHGIAGLRSKPHRKMFEEHGWMISVMSVRPKGVYQTGIPRRFLRDEPTDFWHRELELLPWQSISQKEIWGAGTDAVWGYTPRYDEYRETPSYVSATMRGGTEEDWTLAREFASAPTLNESFITCTPSDRIYLDTSQPELVIQLNNSIRAKRMVSANARMTNRAGI
jgi:hypothetical protein